MNRAEVFELMIEIKANYPNFDTSDEEAERYYSFLQDFPLDAAMENIRRHILTDEFPPKIANIRGKLGEQLERKRAQEATEDYFAQLEVARLNAAPPPPGNLEKIKRMLGVDGSDG
ncbi:replicative helicase loader/inhibitor [Paenibacillus agilis]|uniref:Replicative helicase inhibitor G39P N-terminal domain-containing protein n=1 Tax=Paenibacillus agilis TaxID=3020863 RepID=A0A559IZG7_9BACL|nr:replicative helicase loader/inhibitor [Paenibacillus agilis]TVX93021.1 hypothetical protein FPZ44_08090 [Paenibacillus agilis]